MKTHISHNFSFHLALTNLCFGLNLALVLVGCGTDAEPFYASDLKNYGAFSTDTNGEYDAIASDEDAFPWSDHQQGETESDQSNAPIVTAPELDPGTPISHSYMQLAFDTSEVWKLRTGKSPETAGFILRNQVQQRMSNDSTDHAIMRQNFGDGISLSDGTIHIRAKSADAQQPEGEPSVSGMTSYVREVGHTDCPKTMVCATSMTHQPTVGTPFTMCFHNPITKERTVLPISPATNYRKTDFLDIEGPLGTYKVDRYSGLIDCESPPSEALLVSENIHVNLQVAASLGQSQLPDSLHQALPAQYGVTLYFERTEHDDRAPYIDETIRLDHVSHNFLNEDEKVLVQVVNETRASISGVPLVDGVKFKLVLNLCTDYLNPNPNNYCEGVDTDIDVVLPNP